MIDGESTTKAHIVIILETWLFRRVSAIPRLRFPGGPISERVIITGVQVSEDGSRVESITVLRVDGEELTMRLGDEIEPAIWGRPTYRPMHA